MESIDLSTENPLDGSFLNISLEETVHTTKYDSYQYKYYKTSKYPNSIKSF
jgi:hypothetical protein